MIHGAHLASSAQVVEKVCRWHQEGSGGVAGALKMGSLFPSCGFEGSAMGLAIAVEEQGVIRDGLFDQLF